MASVRGQKAMNQIIKNEPGVVAAVALTADKIAVEADRRLEMHRYEGEAKVTVSHGKTDSFVNLDDPAALSIEFGHIHNITGRYVHGLYIVTGAAGII
jgi:hypothetical protein